MSGMRTLVISDLHLGQQGGVSVLTRPRPLALLLEALDGYERLVLLGDVIEAEQAHVSQSLPVAEPVLRALAERLGPAKQLVLVPGNHDHGLIREWSRARGAELLREDVVPPDASPALAEVLSWLTATRVEVRYPGVWLGDGIWAAHGHQIDHYLTPVSSYGLRLGALRVRPLAPAALEHLPKRPAMAPTQTVRWFDSRRPARLAPLLARGLSLQMERSAMPAMAAIAFALGVQARWVIFAHVHRRGPRPDDDAARWAFATDSAGLVTRAARNRTGTAPAVPDNRKGDGATHLLNTGSWRYEPIIARGLGPSGRYWPGGAVSIGADGVPRSIGLLDDLTEAELLRAR